MQIQNAYSSSVNQSTGVSLFDTSKTQNYPEEQTLPSAWGSDRITISAAAREAAEAARIEAEQQIKDDQRAEAEQIAAKNALFSTGSAQADVEAGANDTGIPTGPGAEFSAYMEKSTSKAQASNPEERLKDLQDKLQSLEGQLAGMVKDGEKPGQGSKVEMITAQINTIMKEIAELMSQMAEDAKSKAS